MNICGVLIHASPTHTDRVKLALEALPGVEVHAATDDSRFVVVVEDTNRGTAADQILKMHQLPGVVSATLSYHHFEPEPDTEPLNRTTTEPGLPNSTRSTANTAQS